MTTHHEPTSPARPALENSSKAKRDRRGSRSTSPASGMIISDLAKSRMGLSALLKALPIAGYVTDVDGFIAFYNDAAAELWGHRPEKGIGRWCESLSLFWPDGRPMADDDSPMALCLKEGRANRGREMIAERPDGTRVDLVNYATPIEDRNGRSIGALNMLAEVSAPKRTAIEAARTAAIVEGSDDAIIGKTLDGIVTSWNPAAVRIFGFTAEEMIGQSILRIIPDHLRDEEHEIIAQLKSGKRLDHFDTIRLAKGGRRVEVSLTVSPLRDETGNVVGVSKIARDVTDRRQVEEVLREAYDATQRLLIESQRLSAIVDGSDDAIIGKDLRGKVTSWNAAAVRIFGFTAEEMIGQSILRIVPDDLGDEEREIIARLARGERLEHFDTIRLARDGRRIDVSLTVSPLRDAAGNIVGISQIARDVTERKRVEQALRDATAEAERANRAKTEFLAVMSHEIRTPLNSISGFADLLTTTTELTPQQRRYTDLVRAANAALLAIVDDILDFSKVEAGQLELEPRPFSLSSLIRDTIAIVLPSVVAKKLPLNLTIEPDVPLLVMGDPSRLRQILLNLLNNAVKFTAKGSITLDVRKPIAGDDRERIRFSVTDTGIGVPAEQQDRLFKQFSQADSSISRKHGGTGLGLAICKRLAELMGGEIGIISDAGRGSTIWFDAQLPRISQPASAPEVEPRLENPAATKARILVVDDIETNLEIVEAYLLDRQYRVDCAGSGIEAIQMLGNQHYDLILMDVQMPVMDGVAATKRIRALPAPIRDIPIIAMTGNVLPQQVRSFLDAGMNDHVGKPIERSRLYNNLLRWLPKNGASDASRAAFPPNFERDKFDEFVLLIGEEKAERITEKFLVSLSEAFKSSLAETQREAHGLLSAAGALGLERFVEACRGVEALSPSADPELARLAVEELRRAQAMARQVMTTQLLPKLRGAAQPGTSFAQAVGDLERALIDLKDAATDFSDRRESASDPWERADLETALPRISVANRAVQLALEALGTTSHWTEAAQVA